MCPGAVGQFFIVLVIEHIVTNFHCRRKRRTTETSESKNSDKQNLKHVLIEEEYAQIGNVYYIIMHPN